MANFLTDNDDLQFYFNKWIDWDNLYEHIELYEDPEGPADAKEAREFWGEILNLVGDFAANEIAPYSAQLDREAVSLVDGDVVFPQRLESIFSHLSEMGLHGLCLPRELGGMNCPILLYLLQGEIISRADVSVMTHHSFHGGMALAMLVYSAEEGTTTYDRDTKKITKTRFAKQIAEIAAGEAWGCMDITEPDAGSDMAALRTRATQDENGNWSITGQKIFVTSGHGRYHFVICRTEEHSGEEAAPGAGLDALSLFMVETWRPTEDGGREWLAQIERLEEKLGHHASATVTVHFEDTPAELVGERGEGFKLMLLLMNNARIGVGFEALGVCEAAWRMAREYASVRRSMGKTIDQHELVADMLDEMEVTIQGLRAMSVRAATLNELYNRKRLSLRYLVEEDTDEHANLAIEVAHLKWETRLLTPLIKYVGAEAAVRMARQCVQIHGGFGYTTEYGAEKLLRDAMVLPIYEGTSQIQALMATKDNLLAITREPWGFVRQLGAAWRKQYFGKGPLARRVATLRYQSLLARRAMVVRIVKGKWGGHNGTSELTGFKALKAWDPKTDFGPALLHAENLVEMLADAATAEELLLQAQSHEERRGVLERFLERAEPRCMDRLRRIRSCGNRLLNDLRTQAMAQSPAETPVAQAAK
jgi:alkylation response protein AidB-like acyl-CoA dehydrogenase